MIFRNTTLQKWLPVAVAVQFCISLAGAQPFAYVTSISGNSVSVVNTASNAVVGTVPLPVGPTGIAVSPDGSSVYVASQSANVVSVINTSSNTVVSTINVGSTPTQLAISPTGAQVYVVEQGTNQVAIIDHASKSVVAHVGVGQRPTAVAFSPDGSRAFVTNLWSGNVSIIDTALKAVTGTFSSASGPSSVVVSPDNRAVYVANEYDNSVTVHDLAGNLQSTISGFVFPNSIAITPNGSRVFVSNGNSGTVSAIDTSARKVLATMAVATLPTAVAMSADGTRAYVTNEYGFSVSVIDTASNAVVNTIARVGVYPVGIALQPGTPIVTAAPSPAPPPPPTCTYAISSGSASFTTAGGSGSVTVTAPTGCGWTAASNAGWIALTGGSSGNGNGTVSFAVNANAAVSGLSGTLTIAGQTFTVTQTGLTCSYTLAVASYSIAAVGGTGTVAVATPPGCAWSVASDSPWITLTSAASGSGPTAITFSVAGNSVTTPRAGTLNVAGQYLSVSQAAAAGPAFAPIRVNCGGPAFTDGSGNVWAADPGHNTATTTAPITNTNTPLLYQKEAWSTGTLQYQFTVPNGNATVKLHFAEFYLTQKGQRVFDLVINGTKVIPGLDILGQTGANAAWDFTQPVSVTDGQITVQLVPITGSPKIAALEIY